MALWWHRSSDLNAVYVLHFIAEPGGVVHLALEENSRDLSISTAVSLFLATAMLLLQA